MRNLGLFLACIIAVFTLAGVNGCKAEPAQPVLLKLDPPVVIIANQKSQMSLRIAEKYQNARKLSSLQVIKIDCPTDEEIPIKDYQEKIEKPIKDYLEQNKLKDQVNFIVTTKGVPIRIKEGGYSVDAFLMMMYKELKPMTMDIAKEDAERCFNPYFGSNKPFTFKEFGFYLVTRLDGYYIADIERLIDNSLKAKRAEGPFLIDIDPAKTGDGYKMMNDGMKNANAILLQKKMDVRLDESPAFIALSTELMGYYSWGSNDTKYDKEKYHMLKFKPGAIAETCVSTSAYSLNKIQHWQSLIGDLIGQGVTGVKGYVSEPYSIALCPADVLFDRYTSGCNLAETFWGSTRFLKWKDVVIGDPLCAPFAQPLAK